MSKFMFYHCTVYNSNTKGGQKKPLWKERLEESFGRLKRSGLYDELEKIHLLMNCDRDFQEVDVEYYKSDPKIEVRYSKEYARQETETATWLWDFCNSMKDNHQIFYDHSKGVMRKTISPPEMCRRVDLWNEYLEYWTMYRWKDCVEALKTHHTASCFIKHTGGHPIHYCGNVWWANSKYIQMLHKPNEAIDDTVEMWLLSDLYAKGNSHMGQLDYFKFLRKQHFYSVDQPILIKDIDNPYDDPIERSTYRDGDDPEPI